MAGYTNNVIDEMDISENPALSSAIVTQLNNRFLEQELEASIIEQYTNFDNLGYDFIKDYDRDALKPEILIEMAEHIDRNYLGIEYLAQISDQDRNTYTMLIFLYEILFVDMVKLILPGILKELKSTDIDDIKFMEENDLKYNLLNVVKNIIGGLEEAKEATGNPNLAKEIFKYSYCLDLFDADMEAFIENYIIPVCNRYGTTISGI